LDVLGVLGVVSHLIHLHRVVITVWKRCDARWAQCGVRSANVNQSFTLVHLIVDPLLIDPDVQRLIALVPEQLFAEVENPRREWFVVSVSRVAS